MKRSSFIEVVVACLTVGSLFAEEPSAQPAGPGPAEPGAQAPQRNGPPGTTYRISAGAAHQFDTDLDDSPTDFSMTRYGVSGGVSYPVGELLVDHSLTYEYDDYDFDDVTVITPTGSRSLFWDDSHLLSYTLGLSKRLNDEWSIFGGPSVGLLGESGADWSDAFTVGGNIGVRQQISGDLALGVGVIATSGIEEGATVLPLILVEWRINDRLSLRNARPQLGLRGTAGAELAYELTPKWTVAGGFAYDRRRFRLDDEGFAADGVGEHSSFPVYLRAGYQLNEQWSVGGMAGMLLGGEIRLENEDGHEVLESDYDSTPFVGLSIAGRF